MVTATPRIDRGSPLVLMSLDLDKFKAINDFGGVELQMGTSIGIAFVAQAASANALIALADKALYEAKSAGRNTWRVIED